jgi:hypothetical protein
MTYTLPEKPIILIGKAARREALKWEAGENLRKKLQTAGADAESTRKAMGELAEALRGK